MPKTTVAAQKAVREAALLAQRQSDTPRPFEGPVSVSVLCCFAYPVGTAKKRLVDWAPMAVKPDVENLAKTVLDGCNEVVYHDDAQVVELVVKKFRVADPAQQGMYIEVWEQQK